MLVDVVELDWHESPRPREDVLAQVPARGELRAECLLTDRDLGRAAVHADLTPMTLETLYSCRLVSWRGPTILLAGWQRQPCKGRQTGGGKFPQRWWLRLVLDPRAPPMSFNERQRRRAMRRETGGLME